MTLRTKNHANKTSVNQLLVRAACTAIAMIFHHRIKLPSLIISHTTQGTHDIQHLEVDANSSTIEVCCPVHQDSTALGCFTVALHWDKNTPPTYKAVYKIHHLDERRTFKFNDFHTQSIHVYDIGANLLPRRYAEVTHRFQENSTVDTSTQKGTVKQ